MSKLTAVVSLILVCALAGFGQGKTTVPQPTITPQSSGTTQLLITVSPVNARVVWAAGIGGTYTVTTDGGNTWNAAVVPGAENLQFRDVFAVSDKIAYLMSIGDNTEDFKIYKTIDGGANWTIEFTNEVAGAFYDCFAFWTPARGITHSDSLNGVFLDIRTTDGVKWNSITANMPLALSGEASFAASGTCITTQGANNAWAVTGGASVSRVLATKDGGNTWNAFDTPLLSSPSAGPTSVAFRDARHGIIAGGDLATNSSADAATSSDGGQTWTLTNTPAVDGTIFCVAYVRGNEPPNPKDVDFTRAVVVTAEEAPDFSSGPAAWSPDEGQTWFAIPGVSGNWAVAFANPRAGWFVGNNGQILKISF